MSRLFLAALFAVLLACPATDARSATAGAPGETAAGKGNYVAVPGGSLSAAPKGSDCQVAGVRLPRSISDGQHPRSAAVQEEGEHGETSIRGSWQYPCNREEAREDGPPRRRAPAVHEIPADDGFEGGVGAMMDLAAWPVLIDPHLPGGRDDSPSALIAHAGAFGPPGDPPDRAVPGAEREPAPRQGLRLRAEAVGGWAGGRLFVRDGSVLGTDLELRHDLGLRALYGPRLSLSYGTPALEWTIETEYLQGSGRHLPARDFTYDGNFYAAGVATRFGTDLLTTRALVAFKCPVGNSDGDWVGPVVGLEYPFHRTSLTSALVRSGTTEDWTNYLPYPVAGMAGSLRFGGDVRLEPRVTAGYLPDLPTPFSDGGRLYASVRPSVYLTVPLEWDVSTRLFLRASLEYRLWKGVGHSPRDTNVYSLSTPGISFGIDYHW